MHLNIRYKLFRAKRRMTPSRQFKRGLWIKLSRRWDEQGLRSFAWYQQAWLRWSFALLVGLALVGSVGTGAYAYVSPAVIEGTPLYPLKLKLESWEERLYRTPDKKAKFYLKKIKRREAEERVLTSRNKRIEQVEEHIDRIELKLEKIEAELGSSVDEALREKVRERLEARAERRERKQEQLEIMKALLELQKEEGVEILDIERELPELEEEKRGAKRNQNSVRAPRGRPTVQAN